MTAGQLHADLAEPQHAQRSRAIASPLFDVFAASAY